MDFHYILATDLRIISSNSRRFLPIARLAITRSGRDSRKFSITRYPRRRILLRSPISPLLLLPAVPVALHALYYLTIYFAVSTKPAIQSKLRYHSTAIERKDYRGNSAILRVAYIFPLTVSITRVLFLKQ